MERWSLTACVALAALLLGSVPAQSVDKCKAKISGKDGVITIGAKNVTGLLRWGDAPGAATRSIFDQATCVSNGKAKNCHLADPATLAGKTPPPSCTVHLADDLASCSAYLKRCTPGFRLAFLPPAVGTIGTVGVVSGEPWTVCRADTTAWLSHTGVGGGTYDAVAACMSLGYSGVDRWGGTATQVCGFGATPGLEFYDQSGGADATDLEFTVHWRCVGARAAP